MAFPTPRIEPDDDDSSSTDSADTARTYKPSQSRTSFLLPSTTQSGRSGRSSITASPVPSRPNSPLPQFRASAVAVSSSTSEDESETTSPLLRSSSRRSWWLDDRRQWWGTSRRRRKRNGILGTWLKKWSRWLLRHPFFPRQPITIILTFILLSVFTIFVTLLLMYILNPDKDPLPWRAYCFATPPLPAAELEVLPPAGVLVGVFSIDSAYERRSLVRTTWANHVRSRNGAGDGDDGLATSRTIVRFVMGEPRKDWERRIQLEMETYNDIIILPTAENMNGGKTYMFFSWASYNAWVPPVYPETGAKPHLFSYSARNATPPPLAPHDPIQARTDRATGSPKPWVRPDYVVKMDDDSFVMLAELEARLRLELYSSVRTGSSPSTSADPSAGVVLSQDTPSRLDDPLIYWGYLVTNRLHRFMAGELYALSWSLVEWVSKDATVKTLTKGAEDKQTAKWMNERCWIYNHPKSGTVYTHGFLFPSEVARVKSNLVPHPDKVLQDALNSSLSAGGTPTPSDWAYSSVSTFGVRYSPPGPELNISQSVEALVEGSEMSTLREGSAKTPDYAWARREGRKTRYQGMRVGGTVVVHFIKKNMWFLETALALLEGDEVTGTEDVPQHDLYRAGLDPDTRLTVTIPPPTPPTVDTAGATPDSFAAITASGPS
ncbi:glycosyltransferase family 31 protein [Roridomyces roridus]|uniref:Glycosyltransferase family 31 protein n=1 Tax=Roridomyces roridus TaxID=1738132 RepID=A0AAD7FNV3_9AGAR|nr:glycosyltransferase family 31 protein [Roridomyces roridus]